VAAAIFALSRRIPGPALVPGTVFVVTLLVNAAFAVGACEPATCDRSRWMLGGVGGVRWAGPWNFGFDPADLGTLLAHLPSMLVVAFVGALTILLSVSSLELSAKREFNMDRAMRAHAGAAVLASIFGGFVGIVSIGRTSLNRTAGGGRVAGVVAAAMCLAVLFGVGEAIAYVPRAALGGLVLYIGADMIKNWLWDQRAHASRGELLQILLIVVLVANFGYLVGFFAGVVISCLVFVVAYSRTPLASLTTDLSSLPSTVVRSPREVKILAERGQRTPVFRLEGYAFFGSATKIEEVFRGLDVPSLDGVVLDFTHVCGVDTSAVEVFERILRRYRGLPARFWLVSAPANAEALQRLAAGEDGAQVTPPRLS